MLPKIVSLDPHTFQASTNRVPLGCPFATFSAREGETRARIYDNSGNLLATVKHTDGEAPALLVSSNSYQLGGMQTDISKAFLMLVVLAMIYILPSDTFSVENLISLLRSFATQMGVGSKIDETRMKELVKPLLLLMGTSFVLSKVTSTVEKTVQPLFQRTPMSIEAPAPVVAMQPALPAIPASPAPSTRPLVAAASPAPRVQAPGFPRPSSLNIDQNTETYLQYLIPALRRTTYSEEDRENIKRFYRRLMKFTVDQLKDELAKSQEPSFLPFEDNQPMYQSFGVTPRRKLGFLWLLLLHKFNSAEIPEDLLDRPRRRLMLGDSQTPGLLLGTGLAPRKERSVATPPPLPQPAKDEGKDRYITRLGNALQGHPLRSSIVSNAIDLGRMTIPILKKQVKGLQDPTFKRFSRNIGLYNSYNVNDDRIAGFLWLILLHTWNKSEIPRDLLA